MKLHLVLLSSAALVTVSTGIQCWKGIVEEKPLEKTECEHHCERSSIITSNSNLPKYDCDDHKYCIGKESATFKLSREENGWQTEVMCCSTDLCNAPTNGALAINSALFVLLLAYVNFDFL